MHRNSIINIEKGKNGTKPHVVKALCELYDAPPEVLSQLTGLVFKGKQRGLWESRMPGLEPRLRWFASAEQEYGLIQTWEPLYIPGLLQVPEYLEALRAVGPAMDEKATAAIKDIRFKRQELVMAREPMPEIQMIVGETALRNLDGLPEIKGPQLNRLIELTRLHNVDIRVLSGLHPAMTGAFTVLSPDPEPDDELSFVYIDALDGCRYVEDATVVSRYVETFDMIYQMAVLLEEYLR